MQYDLQWISKHATQSYPLTDQAYAQSVYGKQLPMSFLLDMQIRVPKRYINQLKYAFYIKKVLNNLDTYTVVIGCHIANSVDFQCLCAYGISKAIQAGSSMQDRYYILVASLQDVPSAYKDMVSKLTGCVYVGSTKGQDVPSIQLSYEQGSISPVCVQSAAGLDALVVNGESIQGVVEFRAGNGIKLDTHQSDSVTIIDISIDSDSLYTGASTVQQAVQQIKAALGNPVLAINGVTPNQSGQLTIAGLDCVRLDVSANNTAITISNPCSKPCCGTVYSDAIKSQIDVIKQQQAILRDYFVQQSNNINYMQANLATVIGSK